MIETLRNKEILWPRCDRAYKWSDADNRFIACSPTEKEAAYELNVVLNEADAKDLAGKMRSTYAAERKPDWKDWAVKSLTDVFKKDETGHYIVKLRKKTYEDANSKPPSQWMPNGSAAVEGYQLTSGSKANLQILLKPWTFAGKVGVALRPLHIQLTEIAERQDRANVNPFASEIKTDNPFTEQPAPPAPQPAGDPFGLSDTGVIDDEIPF